MIYDFVTLVSQEESLSQKDKLKADVLNILKRSNCDDIERRYRMVCEILNKVRVFREENGVHNDFFSNETVLTLAISPNLDALCVLFEKEQNLKFLLNNNFTETTFLHLSQVPQNITALFSIIQEKFNHLNKHLDPDEITFIAYQHNGDKKLNKFLDFFSKFNENKYLKISKKNFLKLLCTDDSENFIPHIADNSYDIREKCGFRIHDLIKISQNGNSIKKLKWYQDNRKTIRAQHLNHKYFMDLLGKQGAWTEIEKELNQVIKNVNNAHCTQYNFHHYALDTSTTANDKAQPTSTSRIVQYQEHQNHTPTFFSNRTSTIPFITANIDDDPSPDLLDKYLDAYQQTDEIALLRTNIETWIVNQNYPHKHMSKRQFIQKVHRLYNLLRNLNPEELPTLSTEDYSLLTLSEDFQQTSDIILKKQLDWFSNNNYYAADIICFWLIAKPIEDKFNILSQYHEQLKRLNFSLRDQLTLICKGNKEQIAPFILSATKFSQSYAANPAQLATIVQKNGFETIWLLAKILPIFIFYRFSAEQIFTIAECDEGMKRLEWLLCTYPSLSSAGATQARVLQTVQAIDWKVKIAELCNPKNSNSYPLPQNCPVPLFLSDISNLGLQDLADHLNDFKNDVLINKIISFSPPKRNGRTMTFLLAHNYHLDLSLPNKNSLKRPLENTERAAPCKKVASPMTSLSTLLFASPCFDNGDAESPKPPESPINLFKLLGG